MTTPEDLSPPIRPFVPLLVIGAGILAGAFVGAVTNTINSTISADYFQGVMGWTAADAPRFAVAQGVLEGAGLGLGFGIIFGAASALSTGLRTGAPLPLRVLLQSVILVCACWTLGGLAGVAFAAMAPAYFRQALFQAPYVNTPLLPYAWVGGTIWGAYAGSAIAAIWGCIVLHVRWRAAVRAAHPPQGFEVLPPP
jgi:hypothetical protein